MARITVEGCLDKVASRFELILYQIITQEKAIIRPNHKELEQFLAKLLSS